MTIQTHLDHLNEKHAELENKINEESHRPAPDSLRIMDLKREKLKIKEEIERFTE